MAEDKNKKPKKRFAPGQQTSTQQWGIPGTKQRRASEVDDGPGGFTLSGFLTRPTRQGLNFLGDLTTGFQRNKWDSYGTGLGDQLFGVTKGYYDEKNANPGPNVKLIDSAFPTNKTPKKPSSNFPFSPSYGNPSSQDDILRNVKFGQGGTSQAKDAPMTLADLLAQARALLSGEGGGDIARISYDPQRGTARQNAAEADSNLAAMYAGLSNSIAADEAGIGKSYGDTIAAQQGITDKTGQAIQQGYQSGQDMLSQQAAALGIQEAVANQINSGQTAAGDLQQALAANAGAGQTAQTQLGQNRQAALDYNTVVKNAAQQEGTSQRAQRQADLQRVLADIDMAEQQANQQIDAQNASRRSAVDNSALSLAQWLYGNQTDERRYQDSLQQSAAQMANDRYAAELEAQGQGPGVNRVSAESVALLQELLGYSDPKQFQQWVQNNPSGYSSLAKLLQ